MTKVTFSRQFEKQISRVPSHIQRKAHSWILEVSFRGIAEVSKRPGYHDEPLKGARKNERSVRLNKAYRLIYKVIEDHLHIKLLEIHKHEY